MSEHSPIAYKLTCFGNGHIPVTVYTLKMAGQVARLHTLKFGHATDITEVTEPVPVGRVEPNR